MEYEDTSSQEDEQKKLVIRRDKVVVTKVTEQELSQIKETASRCGMTRSDFIRARVLGYKPVSYTHLHFSCMQTSADSDN